MRFRRNRNRLSDKTMTGSAGLLAAVLPWIVLVLLKFRYGEASSL